MYGCDDLGPIGDTWIVFKPDTHEAGMSLDPSTKGVDTGFVSPRAKCMSSSFMNNASFFFHTIRLRDSVRDDLSQYLDTFWFVG